MPPLILSESAAIPAIPSPGSRSCRNDAALGAFPAWRGQQHPEQQQTEASGCELCRIIRALGDVVTKTGGGGAWHGQQWCPLFTLSLTINNDLTLIIHYYICTIIPRLKQCNLLKLDVYIYLKLHFIVLHDIITSLRMLMLLYVQRVEKIWISFELIWMKFSASRRGKFHFSIKIQIARNVRASIFNLEICHFSYINKSGRFFFIGVCN